jgi:hypothetical protein
VVEAMGGFFELELRRGQHPYPHARAYNLARSAFQALLLAQQARRVWIPHFICSVMPDAARAVDVEVVRYGMNDLLEPAALPALGPREVFLYVNYFGLKDAYIRDTLAGQYGGALIVDNSQALFCAPVDGIPTLYSPRKFVGVPDGGWRVNGPCDLEQLPPGNSANRFDALLGRLANGPEAHYADFQNTEEALGTEGMRGMSAITTRLLNSIDYDEIGRRRRANYSQLHDALGALNTFKALDLTPTAALCYPLLLKDVQEAEKVSAALLKQRIYVPCYWRDVLADSSAPTLEQDMTRRLLPLPVDQRYGASDIARLANLILQASRTS